MQQKILGAQPPPAAVRHALVLDTSAPDTPNGMCRWRVGAGREGAARCARGGRAPHSKRIVPV